MNSGEREGGKGCFMVMHCDAPPLPGQQARGSPRFNYRSARVTCCARSNAAVTVRVYDPDTPSFVLEQQDAGLDLTSFEEHRSVPWNPLGTACIEARDEMGFLALSNVIALAEGKPLVTPV